MIKITINEQGLDAEALLATLEHVAATLASGKKTFPIYGPGGLVGSCVTTKE